MNIISDRGTVQYSTVRVLTEEKGSSTSKATLDQKTYFCHLIHSEIERIHQITYTPNYLLVSFQLNTSRYFAFQTPTDQPNFHGYLKVLYLQNVSISP